MLAGTRRYYAILDEMAVFEFQCLLVSPSDINVKRERSQEIELVRGHAIRMVRGTSHHEYSSRPLCLVPIGHPPLQPSRYQQRLHARCAHDAGVDDITNMRYILYGLCARFGGFAT